MRHTRRDQRDDEDDAAHAPTSSSSSSSDEEDDEEDQNSDEDDALMALVARHVRMRMHMQARSKAELQNRVVRIWDRRTFLARLNALLEHMRTHSSSSSGGADGVLDLSGLALLEVGGHCLAAWLQTHTAELAPHLAALCLNGCSTGPDAMAQLAPLLPGFPALRVLGLRGLHHHKQQKKCHCANSNNKKVHNGLFAVGCVEAATKGALGLEPVMRAVERLPLLTELDVRCNNIGAEMAQYAEALAGCASLRKLNLSRNPLGKSVLPLLAALQHNTTLEHLNLTECHLSGECGTGLRDLLRTNTALRTLKIACNRLTSSGVACVLVGCGANTTLRRLSIGRNQVQRIARIAKDLAALRHLRALDIRCMCNRDIRGGEAALLVSALRPLIARTGVLEELNVSGNGLGFETCAQLLADSRGAEGCSLRHVDVSGNCIGNLAKFSERVLVGTTLRSVAMSYNCFSKEHLQHFVTHDLISPELCAIKSVCVCQEYMKCGNDDIQALRNAHSAAIAHAGGQLREQATALCLGALCDPRECPLGLLANEPRISHMIALVLQPRTTPCLIGY